MTLPLNGSAAPAKVLDCAAALEQLHLALTHARAGVAQIDVRRGDTDALGAAEVDPRAAPSP